MKEAGRVRGGVKPSGGRETLETDRRRGVESPSDHRGFPVLRALKGPEAQEEPRKLELPAKQAHGAVAVGGQTLQEAQLRECLRRWSESGPSGPASA
jgi:hypothetical protein